MSLGVVTTVGRRGRMEARHTARRHSPYLVLVGQAAKFFPPLINTVSSHCTSSSAFIYAIYVPPSENMYPENLFSPTNHYTCRDNF